MKVLRVFVVALATALAVGGCAQFDKFMDKVSGVFGPAAGPAAQNAEAAEPRELDEKEISALTEFRTAAGPAPDRHPAAAHIEDLGQQVMAALADKSMSETDRVRYFGELLARDLDIPINARFVLGKHWRKATKAQRRAYVGAFTDFVIQTYSARLGGVSVDHIEITKTQVVGKKDILVRSRVAQSDSKPIRADWRMRERNGRFRILDVSVEGVSMALMLRQEFASVLRNQGGVDGLIKTLRARVTTQVSTLGATRPE